MATYPHLIVGAPVRKRNWVLPKWKEHVTWACYRAGLPEPEFIFVVGDDDDDSVVRDWKNTKVIETSEAPRPDVREWDTDRYTHMVEVRDKLLEAVRAREPDLFLSLDSDILLHGDALHGMIETLREHEDAWAVGGKTFMTMENQICPSYGMWTDGRRPQVGFKREASSEVMKVDVIMAVKLMSPKAYRVNYRFHHWGEDVGWSADVGARGGSLWWDGRYANKHVMAPRFLDVLDKRVGF